MRLVGQRSPRIHPHVSFLGGGLLVGYGLTRGGWSGLAALALGIGIVSLQKDEVLVRGHQERITRGAGDATCNPDEDELAAQPARA